LAFLYIYYMASKLIPDKKIGELQFYRFPYLELLIAFTPQAASDDLAPIMLTIIKDEQTAAVFLQQLIDKGRKAGLQVFLDIAHIETALPEVQRLTSAVMSMEKWKDIYITPRAAIVYNPIELSNLFGLF
jgi:hypothetical protein